MSDYIDAPYTLKSEAEQIARKAKLCEPHVKTLAEYVERIRDQKLGEVPDFDPLDGGGNAEVLFLLEKPGPMADSSGFISRNNPDPTAKAIFEFQTQIGLPRKKTCLWNYMPYWNGTRKTTKAEREIGEGLLQGLIPLLRNLKVVVLVGSKAQRAEKFFESLNKNRPPNMQIGIEISSHPSPIVKATNLEKWYQIPQEWKNVFKYIGKSEHG
ncbi:MAG: uracil-DNA glycosylase [SAR324 cluster bacterium]|nr:uracil-DNA glycosylase [SAR324 cluster bacterium]